VFEDRMLGRIFGPKRNEMTGGGRKLHNEEFHNLYSSQNVIRMIESRRMRWVRHVTRMGVRRMHRGFGGKDRRKETTGKTKT
jgi:hypothetical protein